MWKPGSFSKAAERLNYTQSTITFQMGQLEQELEAKLFEKVGKRMVLTKAGRACCPMWEEVLHAVEKLRYFEQDLGPVPGQAHRGRGRDPAVLQAASAAEGIPPPGRPRPS